MTNADKQGMESVAAELLFNGLEKRQRSIGRIPASLATPTPFQHCGFMVPGHDSSLPLSQVAVRRVSEGVKKSRPAWSVCAHLRRSERLAILHPSLTAGSTHCRLFEAGLEFIGEHAALSNGHETRREAPGGSSHARKRVVTCEKRN